MNRDAYLTELSGRLEHLPVKERTNVMDYYREYTAELERDGKDICEVIGTPNELVGSIYADTAMRGMSNPDSGVKEKVGGFKLAILSLFALPIGIPLAILFSVIGIPLFIAMIAVVIAVMVSSVVMFCIAITSLVAAICVVAANPMTAMFFAGTGLFMFGFAMFVKTFVKSLWNGSFKVLKGLFSCFSKKWD